MDDNLTFHPHPYSQASHVDANQINKKFAWTGTQTITRRISDHTKPSSYRLSVLSPDLFKGRRLRFGFRPQLDRSLDFLLLVKINVRTGLVECLHPKLKHNAQESYLSSLCFSPTLAVLVVSPTHPSFFFNPTAFV